MDISFQICSLLCIAAYVPISLQAGNIQLQENAKPDVNCLLFGNVGCHSTCALIGKLFVEGGEGSCDESSQCDCKVYQPTTIDDIWFTKFDRDFQSKSLLNQLKTFQKYPRYSFYTTALNAVKDPFLTNNKAKQLLTEILPNLKLPYSLKPSNNQLISTYVNDIDNFNEKDATKLSAFVKSELSTIPEEITDEITRNNYKDRMNEFVNKVNDKVTIQYVTKQLEMISGSPFINQILKKLEGKKRYSSSNDTRSENEEEEKSSKKVIDAVAATVAEELINHADKNQSSPKINRNQLSPSNSFRQRTSIQRYEDKDSFRDTGKGNCSTSTANKTNSKYSSSQWKPLVRAISNNADGYGGVKREWRGRNSYIKYSKDSYGTLTVNWQSGDVTITLKNTYMGDVNQTWKFGGVEISLNNDYMGNIEHKWNFGKTQYILSKSFMGDQSVGWTGVEDFDTLCEYKNYISSWCSQNRDLFPNRCVLFTY